MLKLFSSIYLTDFQSFRTNSYRATFLSALEFAYSEWLSIFEMIFQNKSLKSV